MGKWLLARDSPQFDLYDKRAETCPRYSNKGERVKNPFTYYAMMVLQALSHDLAEHSVHPDDVINIELRTIDDGMKIVYKIEGRLTVERIDKDATL